MKLFLKILNGFFVTLGVIFLIIILITIYLFVADPFEIKPLIKIFKAPVAGSLPASNTTNTNSSATVDKNPLLSPEQEKTLESFGVNPAALPTEITPAMEACFTEKLGSARVNEILQGSEPTAVDFFKARGCLDN